MQYLIVILLIVAIYLSYLSEQAIKEDIKERDKRIDELGSQLKELNRIVQNFRPREDYEKIVWCINPHSELKEQFNDRLHRYTTLINRTITGSLDDACIGALSNKKAVLFGWASTREEMVEIAKWVNKWYPGTSIEFVSYVELEEFLKPIDDEIADKKAPK